jgi:hypothetical protein
VGYSTFNYWQQLQNTSNIRILQSNDSSEQLTFEPAEGSADELNDEMITFNVASTLNIPNRPYDFSKTCPPDGKCSGNGNCTLVRLIRVCSCKTGYAGINCELTTEQFEYIDLVQGHLYTAMENLILVHLSDIESRIHILSLFTSMGVFSNTTFNQSVSLQTAITP